MGRTYETGTYLYFYKDGKVTNRIIESAITFLEEDKKSIVTLQLPPIITF